MQHITQPPWQAALKDFHRARTQGMIQRIIGHLTGQSTSLFSYNEIVDTLGIISSREGGTRQIPLEAIVGSVARYTDFTNTFLPLLAADRDRWASVKNAAVHVTDLPPIEVYQIGAYYFVLDGNHRVSIARQQEALYIDAHVIEVRTRMPFSPDDDPADLIIKAEYVDFLEYTQLDKLRPNVNLWVTVPGQYRHLENHIEAHRFLQEMATGREIPWHEAVSHWYDADYQPLILAIREQGVLRYFPERTETDFYVWLARHLKTLQHELGGEITPELAVPQLITRIDPDIQAARPARRSWHHILDTFKLSQKRTLPPKQTWSQTKLIARYSDRLFSDILVVLGPDPANDAAWQQTSVFKQREQSRLWVLLPQDIKPATQNAWQQAFHSVPGDVLLPPPTAESLLETIQKRVVFSDLLIASPTSLPMNVWQQLAAVGQRPFFITGAAAPASLSRILLVYHDLNHEALFVATYLAEQWGSQLSIATDSNQAAYDFARRYLDLHEVTPCFHRQPDITAAAVAALAAEQHCDLIISGGQNKNDGQSESLENPLELLNHGTASLLICP